MDRIKIPKATAKRLPLYYRYLIILNEEGKDKVSSTELSEAVQVDSASIRRDFSYFGALGKRGYGYDVKNLLSFFKKILNQDTLTNVALVGVGNLGRALLNYNFKRSNNIRISCAFDIRSKGLNFTIGKKSIFISGYILLIYFEIALGFIEYCVDCIAAIFPVE